jgi:hypothetical protein
MGERVKLLTRWGSTTVWDLGSDPNNTLAPRHRIEAGEISGGSSIPVKACCNRRL